MLSKENIKKSFSRNAPTYDVFSDFQKEAGRILIGRILKEGPAAGIVLDVGAGTGAVTEELAKRISSDVYGCDIAWGMVSFAKKHTKNLFLAQADAEELPYKEGVFDIAFSNIAYQWIKDFEKAFLEVNRVLRKGGRFYFSILLKNSLPELHKALGAADKNGLTDMLPDGAFLRSELNKAGLTVEWWEEIKLKRFYDSCLDLIKTFRLIGAGKAQDANIFKMGERKAFFDMVNFYDANFREGERAFATYNVAVGCARKI